MRRSRALTPADVLKRSYLWRRPKRKASTWARRVMLSGLHGDRRTRALRANKSPAARSSLMIALYLRRRDARPPVPALVLLEMPCIGEDAGCGGRTLGRVDRTIGGWRCPARCEMCVISCGRRSSRSCRSTIQTARRPARSRSVSSRVHRRLAVVARQSRT